jgi:hypothetical protein
MAHTIEALFTEEPDLAIQRFKESYLKKLDN